MPSFRKILAAATALAALATSPAGAFTVGPLTVNPSLTSLPPVSGSLQPVDLSAFGPVVSSGTFALAGGATLVLTGISPGDSGQAGVVIGSAGGKYAAPVTDAAADPYAGNYLSTGIGSITIRFPSMETIFGLLWGSVDAYNTISFATQSGPVSFTGAMMPASGGSQGYGGSFYTTILSAVPFDAVTLSSTQYAFEAATFEYGTAVPEPAGMALLGAGLLGLAAVRRHACKADRQD